jgi:hypothetical protein
MSQESCQTAASTWLATLGFTHFVTLTFNRNDPISIDWAQRTVRHLIACIDRYLLGGTWARRPAAERSLCVAIPEADLQDRRRNRAYFGLHYHLLLKVPLWRAAKASHADFPMLMNRWWTRVVPSGTTDVIPFSDLAAPAKLADYVTKRFGDDNAVSPREWIIYPPPTSSTKRFSSPVQQPERTGKGPVAAASRYSSTLTS